MEKLKFMGYEVKRIGNNNKVGNAATKVRIMLIETTLIQSLLANCENWCRIGKQEEELWKKSQNTLLRIVFEQRKGTPYWGMIAESGVWPFKYIAIYRRLMFVWSLVNSSEDRIARKLLLRQSKSRNENYYNEVRKDAETLGLKLDGLEEKTKLEWKNNIKREIEVKIVEEVMEEKKKMKKLRFVCKRYTQPEDYVTTMKIQEVAQIMKVKLNMLEAKANFPNKYIDRICIMCHKEEETTEHLFQCERYRKLAKHKVRWNDDETQWKDVNWLKDLVRASKRIEEIREREIERLNNNKQLYLTSQFQT